MSVWPSPVVEDCIYYDVVQQPEYGNFRPVRRSPKVTFQSEGGYRHQRNQWSKTRKVFELEWRYLTEGEYNMLVYFIEETGSDTFWYVDPASLWPNANGVIIPSGHEVRIIDSDIPESPTVCKYRSFKVTLEEI